MVLITTNMAGESPESSFVSTNAAGMPRDLLIQWRNAYKCSSTKIPLTYLRFAEMSTAKNSSGDIVSNVCNPLQVTHNQHSLCNQKTPAVKPISHTKTPNLTARLQDSTI